jgi:hypothetical protein
MSKPRYPLPVYLEGTWTQGEYCAWVHEKGEEVYLRDILRKCPFAVKGCQLVYRDNINGAAVASNGIDPFTGDRFQWDLVHKWDPIKARGDIAFQRQFYLMPTVDHIDPFSASLELELCTSQTNTCKSQQNPTEFLATCKTIKDHCQGEPPAVNGNGILKAPAKYFLPDFLTGRITLAAYKKWLDGRAGKLYVRDRALGRPFALHGSKELYKQMIHQAVLAGGMFDPFTGAALQWELIGMWASSGKEDDNTDERKFRLLPSVDHIDPASDVLHLEICSWLINSCKGNMNPQEFIQFCARVVDYAR